MTDQVMVGIWGGRGSGKSTLARSFIRSRSRLVVLDPLDEYGGAGFALARSVRAVAHGLVKYWAGDFRIRYVPPSNYEPDALHELAVLLRKAQQPFKDGRDGRPVTLVVEEMNMSFPNRTLPARLSGFPELCSRGRHFGIEVIGVSQRVAEVHTRFRGNCAVSYYFRQDDHADVTTACNKLGPQYRAQLIALQDYQYLRVSQGRVTEGRTRP